MPEGAGFLALLRDRAIQPGFYIVPHCEDFKEVIKNPEVKARLEAGPHGFMSVCPGMPPMGRHLILAFGFYQVVEVFVGYLAAKTREAGKRYLAVFQVSGTAAILACCFGFIHHEIWYKRPVRNIVVARIDGVMLGLLSAGAFAAFWPAAPVSG